MPQTGQKLHHNQGRSHATTRAEVMAQPGQIIRQIRGEVMPQPRQQSYLNQGRSYASSRAEGMPQPGPKLYADQGKNWRLRGACFNATPPGDDFDNIHDKQCMLHTHASSQEVNKCQTAGEEWKKMKGSVAPTTPKYSSLSLGHSEDQLYTRETVDSITHNSLGLLCCYGA